MSKPPRNLIARRMFALRPVRALRRFARRQDGATAGEVSFVALPFLALTFAIIEAALVFYAGQTLEAAVADSARLSMTGQAQSASYTADQFKTQVCNRIAGLFDCAGGVYVDVKRYSTFGAISGAQPVTNNQFDPARGGGARGGPGCS